MEEEEELPRGYVWNVVEDAMSRTHFLMTCYSTYRRSLNCDNNDSQSDLKSFDDLELGDLKPKTIEQIMDELAQTQVCDWKAALMPLSNEAYIKQAKNLSVDIERRLQDIPGELRPLVKQTLTLAFHLGEVMTTADLRNRYLDDLTREVKMQRARERGGEARRGNYKADTPELIKFMEELIEQGDSVSRAALKAYQKGLGTSPDANRKRYESWKKRQKK